jgi:molybdenum cofactor cytidylyltransferase
LRGVPEKARVIALLNQTPANGYLRGRARMVARFILRSPRINGVALGSVRSADPIHEVQRPIGAIVLAAGMSRRMGQSKILLPWTKRKTIIEHIIDQLILSRVDHITVVTGYRGDEVRDIAEKLGVEVVHNPYYETGEMLSSLKAGLRAMPPHLAAAMIVLGDQPRLQPRVISQVVMAYAEGEGDIVAPSYQMRRGHPILISRRYWAELLALPDGGAPRDVINAHQDRIAYVNVDTDSVLGDVDTPQDYAQERWRAGLG